MARVVVRALDFADLRVARVLWVRATLPRWDSLTEVQKNSTRARQKSSLPIPPTRTMRSAV